MAEKPVILLDMDGVLADFPAGVAPLFGLTPEELEAVWKPGEWNLCPTLGVSMNDFWKRITEAGERFWLDLLPMPWATKLVSLIEQHCAEWHIISAPSRCPSSHSGKVKWLKREFGERFDSFALTPHKHLFARPNTILIDDRQTNCDNFEAAGGTSILFPSLGNCLHQWHNNPLPHVARQLGC